MTPSTEQVLTMIPNMSDEEAPLLSGQQVSAMKRTAEGGSEVAALADPRNRNDLTLSVQGRANVNGGPQSDAVGKTPLPWARFSIVLFMLLAEYLTAQAISPVSSSIEFSYFSLWHRFTSA